MTDARERSGSRMNDGVDELDRGNVVRAITLLEQACAIDPSYALPWLNRGLAYKAARQWKPALDAFLAAYARRTPTTSMEVYASLLWNIGITATALGEWKRAAAAWRLLGHRITASRDGSPSAPLGQAWLRRDGMVPVLGDRIDPARIRVTQDRPMETGFSRGQVAVHDAAKVGTMFYGQHELPIFPEL
jgi:hypothetical protein